MSKKSRHRALWLSTGTLASSAFKKQTPKPQNFMAGGPSWPLENTKTTTGTASRHDQRWQRRGCSPARRLTGARPPSCLPVSVAQPSSGQPSSPRSTPSRWEREPWTPSKNPSEPKSNPACFPRSLPEHKHVCFFVFFFFQGAKPTSLNSPLGSGRGSPCPFYLHLLLSVSQ